MTKNAAVSRFDRSMASIFVNASLSFPPANTQARINTPVPSLQLLSLSHLMM